MSDALAQLHAMYDKPLPRASDWWGAFSVEWIANARSPLVETILRMQAQSDEPVCKHFDLLPGNVYKFVLSRAQIERVIVNYYGAKQ